MWQEPKSEAKDYEEEECDEEWRRFGFLWLHDVRFLTTYSWVTEMSIWNVAPEI
jgi:hypothetical protein